MAIFLPVVLVGAPIGYFTWSKVFNEADYQAAKICHGQVKSMEEKSTSELLRESYPPRSGFAGTVGTIGSFGILGKTMFGKSTRHRLFFARAPPGADIRWVTFKMAGEILLRCGAVVYGAAAGGALAGRLAVARQPLPVTSPSSSTSK
ncbi:hypothetical protein BDB00DRAFT_818550 [Zychaea mexicana]|uniref:uncharacterized protein n=1 Tax=Zychaea mexicana TaxID=64656 RepID=UPI0022FE0B3E|nr:uncharacterized protein BDB00DRAFT_818550 [Zychaea mexicana]KAI9494559.1 hypothetical protein BDB00DRAFT_818550 [Zychaea mexicana]